MTADPRQPKQDETFVKAPPWLYRPGLTDREVRAYLALREHYRENGSGKGAIPGEKRVAEILGVSLSTVERAVRGLRAKGAVVVTARPARVRTIIDVPFSNPRQESVHEDYRFAELRAQIRALVMEEYEAQAKQAAPVAVR